MFWQLIAHVIGDYWLQSDWMAQNKRRDWYIALIHATVYMLPFTYITQSVLALFTIQWTHAIIDHFALARYICFAKNFLAPRDQWPEWENCKATGYDDAKPTWLTTWLYIIVDNSMHIILNYLAIRYL